MKRVCIAGFSTRHIAASAHRSGYRVYAVDHFCDRDLSWYTAGRVKFEEIDEIPGAVEAVIRKHRIDMLVVTSGAETLSAPVRLCGTPPERAGRFMDKLETARYFETAGVATPRILPAGTYPAMWKPVKGSGGYRNAVIRSDGELATWKAENEGIPAFGQEVVDGLPASVCCLTDGSRAFPVAANEQILRGSGTRAGDMAGAPDGTAGTAAAYGFSGSVTPLGHPLAARMAMAAVKVAAGSGCLGTIGVDFVLGTDAYAIEVNPRFQGTLDTVEMATGCSLFRLHVEACSGRLPPSAIVPRRYAARGILFAGRDLTVREDLSPLAPAVADIPHRGTEFEEGDAVVSVYGWGQSRPEALAMLDTNKRRVGQYIR